MGNTHQEPAMTVPTTPPCYGEALDQALAFAAAGFRHVTRKGSRIPYLTHLLAVAALVGEFGGTEEQMVVALLHDALEDLEDVTQATLAARFGQRVADAVAALSDTAEAPKPPWHDRKRAYVARIAGEEPGVKLVSCADKLHNLRCVLRDERREGAAVWNRFKVGRVEQVWYYEAMLEALGQGWAHPILEEYREAVALLR
jgi:(p)ppGpp synthase/HD superfamily hydrolase